ncbi:MAG: FHA domain-containing protein [Akkermansia sp.]|nr:FHA domain-containing protein [Akkermansia sp.]
MAIPRYELDCLLFTGIDPKGKALRFCIPFEELQSKRTIYIGRSGVCAIRFDREYKEVSRLHARIRRWNLDDIYICNESEYNPTLVNGIPLYDERLLEDGDELTFGSITLTFHTIWH